MLPVEIVAGVVALVMIMPTLLVSDMEIEKNYILPKMLLVSASIMYFAAISVFVPILAGGFLSTDSVIDGKVSLIYRTLPSQLYCTVTLAPGGLLKI